MTDSNSIITNDNSFKENYNESNLGLNLNFTSTLLNSLESLNIDREFVINNLNSSNCLNYSGLLEENRIKNKEIDNIINQFYNESYNKPKIINYSIKETKIWEDNSISKNNLKIKNPNLYKEVNDILDYNKNLYIINSAKWDNLKIFFNDNKLNYLETIKPRLNYKSYFSELLSKVCKNIKYNFDQASYQLNDKKENKINKNIYKEYKTKEDFNFNSKQKGLRIQRYRKNKEELNYLDNFFKLNTYRWDSKIIKELSEKLFLSKYSIYKWNWDQLKKKNLI